MCFCLPLVNLIFQSLESTIVFSIFFSKENSARALLNMPTQNAPELPRSNLLPLPRPLSSGSLRPRTTWDRASSSISLAPFCRCYRIWPLLPLSDQIAFAVLKGNGNRTCGGEGRVETDILKDKTMRLSPPASTCNMYGSPRIAEWWW